MPETDTDKLIDASELTRTINGIVHVANAKYLKIITSLEAGRMLGRDAAREVYALRMDVARQVSAVVTRQIDLALVGHCKPDNDKERLVDADELVGASS